MQKVSRKFIAGDDASDQNLGFVPDKVTLIVAVAGTILVYTWYRILERLGLTGKYGILDTDGTKSAPSTAETGIISYDTQVQGIKVPAPDGITITNPDGMVFVPAGAASASTATISDWSKDVNYASSGQDRSVSVPGTCVRPTYGSQHINRIFELVTGADATGGTDTDIWDVVPGTQITDCNGNVWLCRQEITCVIGGKGVEIGATVMVDSDICILEAELHDEQSDAGDAGVSNPI